MKLKTYLLGIAASLALIATIAPATSAADRWGGPTERSLVFNRGDFGSKYYRIPAITVAADGAIIAVADKRIETINDLPNPIYIVVSRTTDNGRTWRE